MTPPGDGCEWEGLRSSAVDCLVVCVTGRDNEERGSDLPPVSSLSEVPGYTLMLSIDQEI